MTIAGPMNECILVVGAGALQANGRYIVTDCVSGSERMYRKEGSNIGLLRFDDGRWYISDCGAAFTPSGVDHLDFYVSAGPTSLPPTSIAWGIGEDGCMPIPSLKIANRHEMDSVVARLRESATQCASEHRLAQAVVCLGSLIGLGTPSIADFRSLALYQSELDQYDSAWGTLLDVCRSESLLFDNHGCPLYSLEDRVSISAQLLQCRRDHLGTVAALVSILQETTVYPFFEFLLPVCDHLERLLGVEGLDTKLSTCNTATVDRLLRVREAREEFKRCGGVDIAIHLRQLYRRVDLLTFSTRDTAVVRMRIFSVTDALRQVWNDGRVDDKGRDATFTSFWDVGINADIEDEARMKDMDPAKEDKCAVIKAVADSEAEADLAGFQATRERLLQVGAPRPYALAEVQLHDCRHPTLKLISIHGVVFDVTDNLDKYAPNGEYAFVPGHDITYCLAISSLGGDFVDHMYRLTEARHLKRVYGWMEYFQHKYAVVGHLKEYADENKWERPPQVSAEPDMQCSIM